MKIRKADKSDAEAIKAIYHQAFDASEADSVADLAVNLLAEAGQVETLSLVVLEGESLIGHVAYSPVFLDGEENHIGYILAPLAIAPNHQRQKLGSSLVQFGIDAIAASGDFVVLVYGDPAYYSRFGFETALAEAFAAPFPLTYPHGWQALKINEFKVQGKVTLKCVEPLNSPELW